MPRVSWKCSARTPARDAGLVERLDHVVDAGGSRDADRVADRDLVDLEVEELVDDLPHRLGRDVALVGTAEGRRDVAAHADPLGLGARDAPAESARSTRRRRR